MRQVCTFQRAGIRGGIVETQEGLRIGKSGGECSRALFADKQLGMGNAPVFSGSFEVVFQMKLADDVLEKHAQI